VPKPFVDALAIHRHRVIRANGQSNKKP
jgi:hypothetical protein